jgi:long-chain acyl-CoA synthetase
MNENSRIFDCIAYQLSHFPKKDMFAEKENGAWKTYSTETVQDTVNKLSAGLLQLGVSGNNMEIDNQDKIALISRNRPEWLMLDMACQQIGAALCPIYPTTNVNELEFIFNDATVKYVFISGHDILNKVNNVRDKVPSLKNVYSFDELEGVDR